MSWNFKAEAPKWSGSRIVLRKTFQHNKFVIFEQIYHV